jgi:hypothetical protein
MAVTWKCIVMLNEGHVLGIQHRNQIRIVEEIKMRRKGLLLSAVLLIPGLICPLAMTANAASQGVSIRFYDRDHKDYHNWDDNENRRYEEFRRDHPKYSVKFSKTSRAQQREYWKWRHEHE